MYEGKHVSSKQNGLSEKKHFLIAFPFVNRSFANDEQRHGKCEHQNSGIDESMMKVWNVNETQFFHIITWGKITFNIPCSHQPHKNTKLCVINL